VLSRLFVEARASNGRIIMPEYTPIKNGHPDAVRIWRETSAAMDEVLETGYVFFDLKIGNILLDHEGHVVLADIGGLAPATGTPSYINTFAYPGHTGFVAVDPDALDRERFGRFVTDWALLQLAFDLLGLRSDFDGQWTLGFGTVNVLGPERVMKNLQRTLDAAPPQETLEEMLVVPSLDPILGMMSDQIKLARRGGRLTVFELRAVLRSFYECANFFPAPAGYTVQHMRDGARAILTALSGLPDDKLDFQV
jgi:serine/threonine protein kinase